MERAIPLVPQTLEGWAKKLQKKFDANDIKLIVELHRSGMLEESCEIAINNTEKIDFEIFWEIYSYKVGGKQKCKVVWDNLSYSKQKMIIEEAVPRYKRYTEVSGISRCQPVVWLRGRRWNDEIATEDDINKLIKAVNSYFHNVLNWKKKYAGYHEDSDSTVFRAAESFLYRYPQATALEVCGVLRWMVESWGAHYRHLVKPVRAMSVSQWPKYKMLAAKEIEAMQNDRQKYLMRKIETEVSGNKISINLEEE